MAKDSGRGIDSSGPSDSGKKTTQKMVEGNSMELNLKTLLEFKKNLLEEQKNGEQRILQINEKIEQTKKEIDIERQKLEEYRIKLKEVNEIKDVEYPKFVDLKEQLMKARTDMKTIDERAGTTRHHRSDINNLTKAFSQVERDIQTKKLSKEEERKLVARSKEIANKLHALKMMHKKEDQYRDISSQYDSLKSKINEIFDFRADFGNHIGELKKILDKLLETRETLYEERRQTIRNVRENEKKIEMVDTQINAIEFRKSRISSLGFRQRKPRTDTSYNKFEASKERAKRIKENQQIWDNMKEEAMKKMSSGEKLTFDEMKLIYGDLSADIN